MTKTILRYDTEKQQNMQLDEQDVEIIRVLNYSTNWISANEIKRMGNNMPEEYLIEKKFNLVKKIIFDFL